MTMKKPPEDGFFIERALIALYRGDASCRSFRR